MMHGREQETENAAREQKNCCLPGGPLPKLIAMGAALESLMQLKLCSFLRIGIWMIGEWIGHIKGETRHGERVERRTNFDGQIVRKQRSICRVRWSSNVTCQQAKNKVVFFLCFFSVYEK